MFSQLRRSTLAVVVLVASSAHAAVAAPLHEEPSTPVPCASASYSTRGVIKAFGPDRRTVSIAHEDIPGFMMAMTMSFQPRTAAQLTGLAVGDRVQLSFTATEDGLLLLDSIRKP